MLWLMAARSGTGVQVDLGVTSVGVLHLGIMTDVALSSQ